MAQPKSFQYQERIGPGSFRLFLIQPCPDISAPLEGTLVATTLSEYDNSISDQYIALSYVWGDTSERRMALINGMWLDITASLDSALRHIRDPKEELKIWADGICINQTDVEERNIQVQQMGLIYQLARHTIIYLGDSTPGTAVLLDVLRSSSSSLETHGSGYMANILRVIALDRDHAFAPRLASVKDVQVFVRISIAREWPWFRRIWVLQELVLSLDPWVQIGPQRIRWDLFSEILNLCSQDGSLPDDALHILSMVKFRNTLSLPLWQRQLSDDFKSAARLLDLLVSRRGLGVTDPRDMIYGHLGVLGMKKPNNLLDNIIRVDYNQSVSDLFTQVALYMISARKGFDIFSHVADIPVETRTQLPTWVPDWTYPYSRPSDIGRLDDHILGIADIEQLYVLPSVRSPQVLGLLGRHLGTIEVVLDSRPPRVDLEAICESLLQSPRSDTSDTKPWLIDQIYVTLLKRLNDWLKEQGVTQSAASMLPAYSYPRETHASLRFGPGSILWNWIAAHVDRPSQPLGPTPIIDDSRLAEETGVITALLLGMTDTSAHESFPRERIAILRDGALMIVPTCAQKGDTVCQFCPESTAWVLRRTLTETREELDVNVIIYNLRNLRRNHLNPRSRRGYIDVEKVSTYSPFEYFKFIGRCRQEPRFPKGLHDWLGPILTSVFVLH